MTIKQKSLSQILSKKKLSHSFDIGFLLISSLLFFIIGLFLFSPAPTSESEICGLYQKINQNMGFVVNCDTNSYLVPAKNPKYLLEKNSERRSRPLYIIMGNVVGRLFGTIVGSKKMTVYFYGYIIINFLIILTSIDLYRKILVSLDVNKSLISISLVYLVCNNVVKVFFWSATPQLFGILTPIFATYIGLKIIKSKIISKKYLAFFTFSAGLLPLVYGNFIFLGFIIIGACYYNLAKLKLLSITSIIQYGTIVSIIFFLPTVIWIMIVTYISGEYYNAEVVIFREIIWIFDSFKYGVDNLVFKFLENTDKYFSTIKCMDILPFIFIFMLLSFYLTLTMKDIKKDLKNSGSNEIQVYSLLYSIIAIFFFFFWILGYYATRLTFTIVPPIVMFNTIAFNRTIKYLAPFYKYLFLTLIFIVTLIWCYYHITNYGPFS